MKTLVISFLLCAELFAAPPSIDSKDLPDDVKAYVIATDEYVENLQNDSIILTNALTECRSQTNDCTKLQTSGSPIFPPFVIAIGTFIAGVVAGFLIRK